MEVWQRVKQRLEDFCKSEIYSEVHSDRHLKNSAIADFGTSQNPLGHSDSLSWSQNSAQSYQEGLTQLETQKVLHNSSIWSIAVHILESGLVLTKKLTTSSTENPEVLSPLFVLLGVSEYDMPFEQIRLKLEHICQTYVQQSRPVEFLVGNWFSEQFCGEKAIAALFTVLKTQPVLVLDATSESFDNFNLHIGYWGNPSTYSYQHQQIDKMLDREPNEGSISLINFKQNWYQLIPDFVAIWLCLRLDQYFLLSSRLLPPLLLELLPELLAGFPSSEVKDIQGFVIHRLQNLYAALGDRNSAELSLDLAICLSQLPDQSLAQAQTIISMQQQLKDWGINYSNSLETSNANDAINLLLDLIQANFYVRDWGYIKKLNKLLGSFQSDRHLNLVDAYFREEFEFTVVKMNAQGQIKLNRPTKAKILSQSLDEHTQLEMVYVPNGIFQMGSPGTETGHEPYESPMHWVAVSGFFMGRFPVTQSQWRAVANLPAVNHQLHPDPAFFKGDNRPVENISWFEAVEFCDRLAQKTGINYRLPSEAEWEYACRAGSKTPFHFGYTISPEVANYDATYAYGYGTQGEYRQETTNVGNFNIANPYGLSDMHGLVLEWCSDTWHDSYRHAPSDAKPWVDDTADYRILRGGSWYMVAGLCRSAARFKYHPDIWLNHIGFRIAMSV